MTVLGTIERVVFMKRRLAAVAAAVLIAGSGMTAYAGQWVPDDSISGTRVWNYYTDQGDLARDGWYWIDGQWYYCEYSGMMRTGWLDYQGEHYYCHEDGSMAHDTWIDGAYYVGADGRMLTDTVTPDGYYVGADGKWVQTIQTPRSISEEEAIIRAWNQDDPSTEDDISSLKELDAHGILYACSDQGSKYFVKFRAAELVAQGGSGTIFWTYVDKDTGRSHR